MSFCLAVTVVWGHRTNQMKKLVPALEGYVFTNPVATGTLAGLGANFCTVVLRWFSFSGAICSGGEKRKEEWWSQVSPDISKDEYLWRTSRQSLLRNSQSKEPIKSFRVANRRLQLQEKHEEENQKTLFLGKKRNYNQYATSSWFPALCIEASVWDNVWKSKSKASNTSKVWMTKVTKNGLN